MFSLHVLSRGKDAYVSLSAGTRWRIWRQPPCEIVVSDKRISGEHAEIVLDSGKLRLRLTKGKIPIVMEGAIVQQAEISPGTSFNIGETCFTVVSSRNGMHLLDAPAVLRRDSGRVLPRQKVERPPPPEAEGNLEVGHPPPGPVDPSVTRLLAQLVSLLDQAKDQETLGRLILDLALQRLNADRAVLARVEDADHLRVIALKGIDEREPIRELISTSVLKQIVDQRCAVVIGAQCTPGMVERKSIVRNHIKAVTCTPIFNSTGQLWALLYVDNQDRYSEFSVQDAELLIWLGQIYSLLYENLEMGRRLDHEATGLKEQALRSVQVVAKSEGMIKVLERVKKAAASDANILILGESGTGKERVARLLHMQSPRSEKALVARNCAAIPENLFESEMFGHRKGAFTGAESDRKGAFLEADGGTLFLDEIGDLDGNLQTKLLRAIQERKIRQVGSDKELEVDVRLISATNRDLREACKEKTFRDDLYFRIATVVLEIPPLRERKEDIAALAEHFTRSLSNGTRTLSEAAVSKLLAYRWPGNVRELLSILEQAIIFSAGSRITPDDLALPMAEGERIELGDDSLLEVERRHILQVLNRVSGNKTEAARILGLARSTLILKLKQYSLPPPEAKAGN